LEAKREDIAQSRHWLCAGVGWPRDAIV